MSRKLELEFKEHIVPGERRMMPIGADSIAMCELVGARWLHSWQVDLLRRKLGLAVRVHVHVLSKPTAENKQAPVREWLGPLHGPRSVRDLDIE